MKLYLQNRSLPDSPLRSISLLIMLTLLCGTLAAESLEHDVEHLLRSSCSDCHDDSTETPLNFEQLGFDLSDPSVLRTWEKVFDRVKRGEMPPATEPRPDEQAVETALVSLKDHLTRASRHQQQRLGRVPARRLTKLEFGYTLRDLLQIESDVTRSLPDEIESESFDTVGRNQRISAVHMESYLQAADDAFRFALNLGRNPYRSHQNSFDWLDEWHDKPLIEGGSITRKLKYGDGIVLFVDIAYLTQFQFQITTPGIHRIKARVGAYQTDKPLTAKIIVKAPSGETRLAKAVDLLPGGPKDISVETFLKPGDTPYLTFDVGTMRSGGAPVYAAGGAQNYRGPGLAILSQEIEGPLLSSWPPPSTRILIEGMKLRENQDGSFTVQTDQSPAALVSQTIERLAPIAFRRPVSDVEVAELSDVLKPAITEGRDSIDLLRLTVRSLLSSPQFLLFGGEPGKLDDYALASRLSYFLWKSMPDDKLRLLASEGKLGDSEVLAGQVDRMLEDEKSRRFIDDFIGQWLRLDAVNATTPDDGLYPEFDEILSDAIPRETQLFFLELVQENRSVANLIDSDFTILNRRLAEHYGIAGIDGQQLRLVELPKESPRGGVLTQAAILKTTANGTTTSPVVRGNFVLTNLLGTPPPPPPPDVGSVEPDTRGKTTIREMLKAHRELESCHQCHQHIDPPGFALESFDPIGGYRSRYRVSGGEHSFGGFTTKLPPKRGAKVDASGVTADGRRFQDIRDFKRLLMQQKEQIARNLISKLVVYATGGEIQFADRDEVESILDETRADDFPIRDILHKVVQSDLFRNQ